MYYTSPFKFNIIFIVQYYLLHSQACVAFVATHSKGIVQKQEHQVKNEAVLLLLEERVQDLVYVSINVKNSINVPTYLFSLYNINHGKDPTRRVVYRTMFVLFSLLFPFCYPYHWKMDLLFWQLYFSPELQLLTWFYGMLLEQSLVTVSYGQYSAHGAATGTTEYATKAGSLLIDIT